MVKRVFDAVGFETKENVKINDYEIDILAKYLDYAVAIVCKEKTSGGLVVKNLIREWSGKNKVINTDKILLAIDGKIKSSDIKLAREKGMIIWSKEEVQKLLDQAEEKEEVLTDILDRLNIETKK